MSPTAAPSWPPAAHPRYFEVTGEGRTDGSATFNAGGKAVGKGVAEVTVQFKGSTNGLGTPTTFTITVD